MALDVARIIAKPVNELLSTDITDRTVELLKKSNIKQVHLFGRRGPAQVAFTNKELRELFDIQDCKIILAKEDIEQLNAASETEVNNSRARKRMIQLLLSKSTLIPRDQMLSYEEPDSRMLIFIHFFASPIEYRSSSDPSTLHSIMFERTSLTGEPENQKAVATGERFTLDDCGVVFESIGYFPLDIEGIPLHKGAIKHQFGRILNKENQVMNRLYASGWFKRGPSGIIGSNVWDSQETSVALLEDLYNENIEIHQPFDQSEINDKTIQYTGVEDFIQKNYTFSPTSKLVTLDNWLEIEKREQIAGSHCNPPKLAEKFLNVEDMLAVLNKE